MRHLRESIHKALRIFLSAIFQILPGAEGLCNTPEQSELTNGTAYETGAELLEQMRSFFNTFFPKAGGGKQPLPALFFILSLFLCLIVRSYPGNIPQILFLQFFGGNLFAKRLIWSNNHLLLISIAEMVFEHKQGRDGVDLTV